MYSYNCILVYLCNCGIRVSNVACVFVCTCLRA